MELKEAITKLKNSDEYKNWRNDNKDDFLSFAFCQVEGLNKGPWQIGFHSNKTDTATSFVMEDPICIMPPEEEFKKPDDQVNALDTDKINLEFHEIIKKADSYQLKKYPKEIINQKIIIIQNLKDFGNVWNLTYITKSFNTINMKIDPEDGELKNINISSLMDLWKKDA